MESVKGKNILIVGATGRIGSLATKLLCGSGAHVFMSGRNPEKLKEVAENYEIDQDRLFVVDLCNEDSIQEMGKQIHEKIPQIDILVNAAGTGILKPVENLTYLEFVNTIQTNLTGPFLLIKTFLPRMKEARRGLIINIPGVLGKVPMAGSAAYSASKYGVVGMLQSVREEIKRTDIRITNLFLGGTDTPFWDHIDLRIQKDKMIKPEDAARAIWFLCQQPASAVVNEMVLQPFNHQAI
ncbi:MAG: SDR family oxidoreductase [Chitinophagaceae bacterium]|nr:SDR family oxidoreductase [Chitinophagaceae bacterium]